MAQCATIAASSPETATPLKLKREREASPQVPPTSTTLFNGNNRLDVASLLKINALHAAMLQHTPSKKKSSEPGNKLDRAVRKLTDRLESKPETKEENSNGVNGAASENGKNFILSSNN